MVDQKTRLEVFAEFLECAGVALWHFDPEMQLISTTVKEPGMLDALMRIGGGAQVMREYCGTDDRPGFYSDFKSVVYLAVPQKRNGVLTDIYVLGPVFTTAYPERALRDAISSRGLSPRSTRNTLQLLQSVPVIQHTLLCQYGQMLYRCLNGRIPDLADFQPITPGLNNRRRLDAVSDAAASGSGHRISSYALEQQIFKAVEDGNVDYVHPDGILQLTPGTLSHKGPLRSAKNEIISSITLITRAAIRGGMPEESAYALSDYYICMLEDCESVSEVYECSREAFRDFTARVHKCKLEAGRSKAVHDCISYLELHLNRKVSLAELSAVLGYNGNYLSTKFTQEVGMPITEYMTQLRIERARVYLRNTEKSVQEICGELGFTSTSYFCALFKQKTGVTPLQYRNGQQG